MHASELMHDVVLQYDMNYVRGKNAQKHKARTSLSPENELGKHKITPFFLFYVSFLLFLSFWTRSTTPSTTTPSTVSIQAIVTLIWKANALLKMESVKAPLTSFV